MQRRGERPVVLGQAGHSPVEPLELLPQGFDLLDLPLDAPLQGFDLPAVPPLFPLELRGQPREGRCLLPL